MMMQRAEMRINSRRCVERPLTANASGRTRTTSLASQEPSVIPGQASLVVCYCCLRLGSFCTIGTAGRGRQSDGTSEAPDSIQCIGTRLMFVELVRVVRCGRLSLIPTQEQHCTIVLEAGRVCPLPPRIRGCGGARARCRGRTDT